MDIIPLTAQVRSGETAAAVLRRDNQVPGVLYGNDTENTMVQCDYSELFRVYSKAGASSLVELDVSGKKVPVLIHEIEFEPVSDRVIHVDFYAVDMKKEVEAKVPIHFTGVSPAVKDHGGVLVTALDSVTVRCLPANLPHQLEASLETLETFQDSLTVADLQVPSEVTVLESSEQVIATTQEPRKEKEPTVAESAETAEGAEGAEAAEGEKKEEGGDSGDTPSA